MEIRFEIDGERVEAEVSRRGEEAAGVLTHLKVRQLVREGKQPLDLFSLGFRQICCMWHAAEWHQYLRNRGVRGQYRFFGFPRSHFADSARLFCICIRRRKNRVAIDLLSAQNGPVTR